MAGLTPEEITELAQAPKQTSGDTGSVTERSADDIVKLDRHLANKAIDKPPYGMRVAKIKYPGTP
ncbi:MAG: hypothetical protein AB7E98_11950 [Pirellulales bacterium]